MDTPYDYSKSHLGNQYSNQSRATGSQESMHNQPYHANPPRTPSASCENASFGYWERADRGFLQPNHVNRTNHSDDTGYNSSSTQATSRSVPEQSWVHNSHNFGHSSVSWDPLMPSGTPTLESPQDQQTPLFFSFHGFLQDESPSKKRPRFDHLPDTTDSIEHSQRPPKFPRFTNDSSQRQIDDPPMDSIPIHMVHGNSSFGQELQLPINLPGDSMSSHHQTNPAYERVTTKQRKFMRRWYESFVREKGQQAYLSNEHVNALATLIDLQPRTVHTWIHENLIAPSAGAPSGEPSLSSELNQEVPVESSAQITNRPDRSNENSQPQRKIIQLIESHVEACNNKRARTDGRRRVNSGKYECTFNCGYRTKRAFDWKRHEENHQPQNFWLCSVCSQGRSTFLVHRNDKLLKHIKDKHASSNAEDVVKNSEVAYNASFKAQCGFCGHTFESWDERNKHILQHFDGEGGTARNMSQWRDPWFDDEEEEAFNEDEDSSSSSSSSDSSDGEDLDQRNAPGGTGSGPGAWGSPQPPDKGSGSSRGRRGTTNQSQMRGGYYGRGSGNTLATKLCSMSLSKASGSMHQTSFSSPSMHPPTKTRKRKAPTLPADIWNPYKDRIVELHIQQNLPLSKVKESMEKEFGFTADFLRVRQYRTRISQWDLYKKVNPDEMRPIVRKRQQRKLVETDKSPITYPPVGENGKPQGQEIVPFWPSRILSSNHCTNAFNMELQLPSTVTRTRHHRPWLNNNLPLPLLGHGAYGSVDVVQQCHTGQVFARKRSRIASFRREVEVTKRMKHPHIVHFVAAYTQNSSLNLIISPVAESTLRDYLDFPRGQEQSKSRIHRWVGCLSSALSYIHASRIRHADIKPQNILLRDSEVFISDFGISRLVSEPDSTSSSNSPMTPLYAALEIAQHLPHGRNADVFSLGCVFAEMLTVSQGKSIRNFHDFLGISTTNHGLSKPTCYYKKYDRLLSWIAQLHSLASNSTQRLWDICVLMLQDKAKLRLSSSALVTQVREVLQEDLNIVPECLRSPLESEVCRSLISCDSMSSMEEANDICSSPNLVSFSDARLLKYEYPVECQSLCISIPSEPSQRRGLGSRSCEIDPSGSFSKFPSSQQSGSSTLKSSPSSVTPSTLETTFVQEDASSDRTHRLSIVTIISQNSLKICLTETKSATVLSIIAAGPVLVLGDQITITGNIYHRSNKTSSRIQRDCSSSNKTVLTKFSMAELGPTQKKRTHTDNQKFRAHPVDLSSRRICHNCNSLFTAPRLRTCRNCAHDCCEKCPTAPDKILKKELPLKMETDLAAIGSHLTPPAYSLYDEAPGAEQAVFNMVIQQNQNLGDDPGERFLQDSPCTFDLIQTPVRGYKNEWWLPDPSPPVDPDLNPSLLSSEVPPSMKEPAQKRMRLGFGPRSEPRTKPETSPRSKGRQRVSGRTKQTVRIRDEKKDSAVSVSEHHTLIPRLSLTRNSISSSSDTSQTIPRPTHLRKWPTFGSDRSHTISRSSTIPREPPSSPSDAHQVALRPRTADSPPRPTTEPRRSSDSARISGSKEFQHYGRHTNTWLFNDFSVKVNAKKVYRFLAGENRGAPD